MPTVPTQVATHIIMIMVLMVVVVLTALIAAMEKVSQSTWQNVGDMEHRSRRIHHLCVSNLEGGLDCLAHAHGWARSLPIQRGDMVEIELHQDRVLVNTQILRERRRGEKKREEGEELREQRGVVIEGFGFLQ